MKKFLWLILIFGIGAKQLLWIALIPAFHFPDEQAHFGQVQNVAERKLAGKAFSSVEIKKAEERLEVARDEFGNNKFTYHPQYNLSYTNTFLGKYEKELNSIPKRLRIEPAMVEATVYPPLYYQFAAVGYHFFENAGIIDRIFLIRVWQSLLWFLTVYVYFLAAKILFSTAVERYYFICFLAYMPMFSFVGGGITSDNMMNLLFAAVIYLGMKILSERRNVGKTSLLILMVCVLGYFTKPHFVIALLILGWVLYLRILRKHNNLKALSVLTMGFFLSGGIMLLFLLTKGVFIIPAVNSVNVFKEAGKMPLWSYFFLSLQKMYRETLPWFWGVFRWLSLGLPSWLRKIFNFISIWSILMVFFSLIKYCFEKKTKELLKLLFLAGSVSIYYLALFFWDYLFFLSHNFSFGMQGRYYFPVLLPIGALIFQFLPKKPFALFMTVANVVVLWWVTKSYYSFSNFQVFLSQASQYKPLIFKGNALLVLIILFMILMFVQIISNVFLKDEISNNNQN